MYTISGPLIRLRTSDDCFAAGQVILARHIVPPSMKPPAPPPPRRGVADHQNLPVLTHRHRGILQCSNSGRGVSHGQSDSRSEQESVKVMNLNRVNHTGEHSHSHTTNGCYHCRRLPCYFKLSICLRQAGPHARSRVRGAYGPVSLCRRHILCLLTSSHIHHIDCPLQRNERPRLQPRTARFFHACSVVRRSTYSSDARMSLLTVSQRRKSYRVDGLRVRPSPLLHISVSSKFPLTLVTFRH